MAAGSSRSRARAEQQIQGGARGALLGEIHREARAARGEGLAALQVLVPQAVDALGPEGVAVFGQRPPGGRIRGRRHGEDREVVGKFYPSARPATPSAMPTAATARRAMSPSRSRCAPISAAKRIDTSRAGATRLTGVKTMAVSTRM